MDALTDDEKRISPRKSLRTRVVFEDEFSEGFLYFLSTDISLSGLFIESSIPLPVGTRIFLKFTLYEGESPIETSGEIIRIIDRPRGRGRQKKNLCSGIGIRFLGLTPENLDRIKKFVGVC